MDGFEGTPLPVPAPTPRPTPEPTPTAVSYSLNSVSAGYFATFVLNDYGGIWATGYSGVNGQLGDSPSSTATTYSITTVQRVDGSIENIALMRQSKGYQSKSTCVIAVSTSGTLVFWPALTMSLSGVTGATYGIEELTGFSSSVVNAAVAGMDSGHSICAILDTGAVECVGYNGYGQLGDGTATNQAAPVAVTGLPSNFKATQLALGKQHGCTSNTTNAFCWGYNYYGNVGCGDNCARGIIGSAVSVVGSGSYGSDVSDLQCGYYHCCMRFASGNVSCWGSNDYGQLGDGANTARSAPVTVIGGLGGGAVSMSLATYSTCALMADGSLYCWVRGGLGRGGRAAGARAYVYVCRVVLTSRFFCLFINRQGINSHCQLGDGTITSQNVPTLVTALASGYTIASISAGDVNSCVTTSDGAVLCWGSNGYDAPPPPPSHVQALCLIFAPL